VTGGVFRREQPVSGQLQTARWLLRLPDNANDVGPSGATRRDPAGTGQLPRNDRVLVEWGGVNDWRSSLKQLPSDSRLPVAAIVRAKGLKLVFGDLAGKPARDRAQRCRPEVDVVQHPVAGSADVGQAQGAELPYAILRHLDAHQPGVAVENDAATAFDDVAGALGALEENIHAGKVASPHGGANNMG